MTQKANTYHSATIVFPETNLPSIQILSRFTGKLEERRLDSSGGNRHLTRIGIFLNPQVFLSGLKYFFAHTKRKNQDSLPIFTRCVWTEAVYGKEKLRIQKYADTCGQGLSKARGK